MPYKSKLRSIYEAQAFAEFLMHELYRHIEDIASIEKDLKTLYKNWGVKPMGKYKKVWIEVDR